MEWSQVLEFSPGVVSFKSDVLEHDLVSKGIESDEVRMWPLCDSKDSWNENQMP